MSREEARWLTAGKGAAGRGSAQARVAQGRGREEEAGEAPGTCRSDSYVCVGRRAESVNGIWIVRTPVFSHWLWFHVRVWRFLSAGFHNFRKLFLSA